MSAIDKLKNTLYSDELVLSAIEDFEKSNPMVCLAGGCSLDTHPTEHNWVEDAGGLPQYICEVARAILRGGHTSDISRAISIAVGKIEDWAAGKGNVNAETRAKATAAVAEWNAKRAKAKATK
jgi:hypothetical protein